MRASLIDVSRWQVSLDGAPVKAAGFCGLVSRCTIGWSYLDEQYLATQQSAKAAGLIFGAYHVLYPSNRDPEREAAWFLSNVGDADFLVVDIERTHGLSKAEVIEQTRRLCLKIRELAPDKRLLIYTGSWFWTQCGSWENDPAIHDGLWEAEYTIQSPRGGIDRSQQPEAGRPNFGCWPDWKMWQWTSGGKPIGVQSESLDYNVYNGTEQELRQWLGLELPPAPGPLPLVTVTVTHPGALVDVAVEVVET